MICPSIALIGRWLTADSEDKGIAHVCGRIKIYAPARYDIFVCEMTLPSSITFTCSFTSNVFIMSAGYKPSNQNAHRLCD
jgi:hypothetical protein